MEGRRNYGEGCAIAHGLDLVGERWALLIVRELLLGPKRFNVLKDGIRQAGANALSQRLKAMEQDGIVRRRRLGTPTDAWVWELTAWGYGLEPVVLELARWAAASPALEAENWFSPDALMLRLKAHASAGEPAPPGTYRVTIGHDGYTIVVDGPALRIERGEPADPAVAIAADLDTLTAVVRGRETFASAREDGRLVVHGAPAAAEHLLTGSSASEAGAQDPVRTAA